MLFRAGYFAVGREKEEEEEEEEEGDGPHNMRRHLVRENSDFTTIEVQQYGSGDSVYRLISVGLIAHTIQCTLETLACTE